MLFYAENHKQRTQIRIITESPKQQISNSETMSCGGICIGIAEQQKPLLFLFFSNSDSWLASK